jgi:Arc/MetJ-type ribon-helix-helix transcriptional regulator
VDRLQINVRLTPEITDRLDQKRIELQPRLGRIPTRSEVMRYAIDAYLGISDEGTQDKARGPARQRSRLSKKTK